MYRPDAEPATAPQAEPLRPALQADDKGTARYQQRRQAIIDAAAACFNTQGLKGATLADIGRDVGLVTSSVTYYFRRKEALAVACFEQAISTHLALADAAWHDASSVIGRVQAFVMGEAALAQAQALGQRPVLIEFYDIRALPPELESGVFERYTTLFRAVRRLLDGLTGEGLDRHALNARAHLLLSAVNWLRRWLTRHEPDEYPSVARRCLQLLLHGLAATGQVWPAAPGLSGPDLADPPEGACAALAPQRLAALAADDGGAQAHGSTEIFLRAATELVNEQGYRGASIDRIAARLQMTKGAVYHHHDNKLDLIAACFERSQRILRQTLGAAAQLHGDGWQRACAATAALVRFQLSEQGPLLRATAYSALPDLQTRQLVQGRAQRLDERMVGLLVDGMVDGSVRPHDPVVAAQLLACASNAAAELRRWVPGLTIEQSHRLYARPALCGLLAPP